MPTGTLTISTYTANPPIQVDANSLLEVRGWYTRDFISIDGVSPVFGNSTNGEQGPYYSTAPALNVSGDIVVPAHDIQITVGANPTANYFEGLWVDGAFVMLLMPNTQGATGWQIPSVYGDPIAYDEIATYNRAKKLVYAPESYFTADQTIQEIERLAGDFAYAAVGVNGITSVSVAPVVSSLPIAVETSDPRVTADRAADIASIRTIGTGALEAAAGNDARFPTSGQKDALAGTYGTPSTSNKYVTNSDPRLPLSSIAGDGILGTTGNTTSGSNVFNDANAAFVAGDVSKKIVIETTTMPRATAGFIGSIIQVNSPTQVVLSGNVSATWVNTRYKYGSDNTAALNAAFAAGGKVVISGTEITFASSNLSITKPVSVEGEGGAYPKYFLVAPTEAGSDVIDFSLIQGVQIVWAGGASNFLNVTNTGGVELHNLILDGCGVALIGANLDRVRYLSGFNFHSVRSGTALFLGSTTSLNDGSFKNDFYNGYFQGTKGIVFDKSEAGSTGGFLNTFHNTQVEYTSIGIDFQMGDNNVFTGNTFTWNHLYPTTGTINGVNYGTGPFGPAHTDPFNPYSCYDEYFQHLMTQGVTVAVGNTEAGAIDNLDQANGTVSFIGPNQVLTLRTTGFEPSGAPFLQNIGGIIYRSGGMSEPPIVAAPSGTLSPVNGPYQTIVGDKTLPLVSTVPGYVMTIINIDVVSRTLTAGTGDGINGATTYALSAQWKYVKLMNDGLTSWVVVANN